MALQQPLHFPVYKRGGRPRHRRATVLLQTQGASAGHLPPTSSRESPHLTISYSVKKEI